LKNLPSLINLNFNSTPHGAKNYLPENFIDDCFDLVIWGHEHECLINPVPNADHTFEIMQPGSSVATSLSEGESKEKFICTLSLTGIKYEIDLIKLKTVRPFVMEELVLGNSRLNSKNDKQVTKFLIDKVEEMIEKSQELKSSSLLPLIRLRVEYSDFNTINNQRFGQNFVNKVANPKDILLFHRKRQFSRSNIKKVDIEQVTFSERLESIKVEDLINEYLHAQQLGIFKEIELGEAIRIFVEKDDKSAIQRFVDKSLDISKKSLISNPEVVDETQIRELAYSDKVSRKAIVVESKPVQINSNRSSNDGIISLDGDEDSETIQKVKTVKKTTTAKPKAKPKPKEIQSTLNFNGTLNIKVTDHYI
jgi:double-strand break repair protein MRE11